MQNYDEPRPLFTFSSPPIVRAVACVRDGIYEHFLLCYFVYDDVRKVIDERTSNRTVVRHGFQFCELMRVAFQRFKGVPYGLNESPVETTCLALIPFRSFVDLGFGSAV